MFCVNCGTEFNGKFCPECGTKAGDNIRKNIQSSKELEILRNARECLIKLEESNIRLELTAAQGEYLNDLIDNVKQKMNESSINDEKKIQIEKKEQEIKNNKQKIEGKEQEIEVIKQEIEKEKQELEEKKQEMETQIQAGPKKRISFGKAALAAYTLGVSALFTGLHSKNVNVQDQEGYEAAIEKMKAEIDDLEKHIVEKEKRIKNSYDNIKELQRNIERTRKNIKDMKNTIEKSEMDIEKSKRSMPLLQQFHSRCEEQFLIIFKEAKNIVASDKWREVKTLVNPNYLDLDSIVSLIEYLTYGRASTWKEACNLLEDKRYKDAMLNVNVAQLSMQQQMVEAQNELINLTIESIGLQEISIGFQVESINLQKESIGLKEESMGFQIEDIRLQAESIGLQMKQIDLQSQSIDIQREQLIKAYQTNQFLNKQLEEMQKIRRDTRKIGKIQKMEAFRHALDVMTPKTVYIRRR